jgi:hypothetical protein
MKINGFIEIHVKDKVTLETINIIKSTNVVTEYATINLFMKNVYTSPLGPYIGISSDSRPQTRYRSLIPTVGVDSIRSGYVSAGISSPLWVEKTSSTPQYVQYQNRFDAPATSNTINTVFLTSTPTTNTISAFANNNANSYYHAYTKLSVPCIQTPTQILDVYYRVEFPYTNNMSLSEAAYRGLALSWIGNSSGYAFTGMGSSALASPSVSEIDNVGFPINTDLINCCAKWYYSPNVGYYYWLLQPAAYPLNSSVFNKSVMSIDYTATQFVGKIFNTMYLYANPVNNQSNTQALTWSPLGSTAQIQPLFGHSSNAVTPFLDVNTLASGSGSVTATGNWVTKQMPELYSINITSTGNLGTATYNFSKRNHIGFWGSTYNDRVDGIPALMLGYNGSKCSKVHGLTASSYDSTIKYDSHTVLQYDVTGVTKYDLVNGTLNTFDATSTSAMPVTSIQQVSVGIDGSIWVACAATGLWKISADNNSVSNITTPTNVIVTKCYGVDIGYAGAICALFDGGYCISSNNGITWTTYNSTSTPSFTQTGITDNKWSAVRYLRVDPATTTFNTLIVKRLSAVGIGAIWWNISGISNNAPSTDSMRNNNEACNVSDNTSFWACSGDAYGYQSGYSMSYGLATTTMLYNVPWYPTPATNDVRTPSCSIQFEISATGTDALLSLYGSQYNTVSQPPSYAVLYNPDGTYIRVSLAGKSTYSGQYPGNTNDAPLNASGNHFLGGIFSVVNLGKGMAFCRTSPSEYYGSGFRGAVIFNWAGDGTYSGGVFNYLLWDKYGWDGSKWVLGDTSSKVTHTSTDALVNGINISFVDGTSAGVASFTLTDYYTFSVNDGVLKDNATTFSYSNGLYYKPIKASTDFSTPTVTNMVGSIGDPVWNTNTMTSGISINSSNRLVTNATVIQDYPIGAQSTTRLLGDFKVDFTTSGVNNFMAGVGTFDPGVTVPKPSDFIQHAGNMFGGNVWDQQIFYYYVPSNQTYSSVYNGVLPSMFMYGFQISNGNCYYYANTTSTVSANNIFVGWSPAVSVTSTVSIQRIGTTVNYIVDGTVRFSMTHQYAGPMRITMTTQGKGTAGPYLSPTANIVSNGSLPAVELGNQANQTGVYDPGYVNTETGSSGLTQIKLNGNNVATTNYVVEFGVNWGGVYAAPDAPSPNINEVTVYGNEGIAVFNSADIGKTVSGTYAYFKNI